MPRYLSKRTLFERRSFLLSVKHFKDYHPDISFYKAFLLIYNDYKSRRLKTGFKSNTARKAFTAFCVWKRSN
ncbi:hypothetical protein MASR1M45_02140 [Candidatus Kapaibacterium sp.]